MSHTLKTAFVWSKPDNNLRRRYDSRSNNLFGTILVWWPIAVKNGPEYPDRLSFGDNRVKSIDITSSYQ